jgi:peroxiredoxin
MKRWLFPIAFLSLALAGVAWLQQWQSRSRTGFAAPDFALPDLHGRTRRLSEFRGKVVFLNVWTTWCPPCRMEMPSMEALYRQFRDQDFVVLAVNADENGAEAARPFVAEFGLTFPVLLDPEGRVSTRYGVTGYPETFIIDRDGHVVKHTIGPAEWQSAQMVDYFRELLERPASGDRAAGVAGS